MAFMNKMPSAAQSRCILVAQCSACIDWLAATPRHLWCVLLQIMVWACRRWVGIKSSTVMVVKLYWMYMFLKAGFGPGPYWKHVQGRVAQAYGIFLSGKLLVHETEHPYPASGEVKNVWSYTSMSYFFIITFMTHCFTASFTWQ